MQRFGPSRETTEARSRAFTWAFASVLAFILALAVSAPIARAGVSYAITDLGTFGGDGGYAQVINDGGQVAGTLFNAAGQWRPFFWSESTGLVDIGTLGGSFAQVAALNNSGQVVGFSYGADGQPHAFSWTQATGLLDLNPVLGDSWAYASDVNNSGQVVGFGLKGAFLWSATSGAVSPLPAGSTASAINDKGQVVGGFGTHAFSWTETGGLIDLGAPGGNAQATYVNERGEVAGTAGAVCFFWSASSGTIVLPAPGPLAVAYPAGLNNNGQLAGTMRTSLGYWHGFVWTQAGGMLDIGTLGGDSSRVQGINDAGQVVGFSTRSDGATHAFVWTQASGMIDLGTMSGGYLENSQARGLNNAGQIVGNGSPGDGDAHAVLWNPVDATPPVIKGPASVTVPATGPSGAAVSFTVTATDNVDPNPSVVCSPASGSVFPIGDSLVTCRATDASGNTASASFTVHVKGAAEQLVDLASAIVGVGPGTSLADKVQAARIALAAGDRAAASSILKAFINEVTAQAGGGIDPAVATVLVTDATRIRTVLG